MPTGRQRKLDTVVAQLQRQYGPRAVGKAAPAAEPVALLSTAYPGLDAALGGGVPRGRITELIGQVTSGKVTLAALLLASAQHAGEAPPPDARFAAAGNAAAQGLVAWVDLGYTCDPEYLRRCDLDLDRLLVVRPRDAADGLAIALHLVESQALDALVFDSVTELAGAAEATVAGALAHLATSVTHTQTAVIFLTEPHAQARALAHAATVRLALYREQWLARGADVRGYAVRVEIVKHKLGRPVAAVRIQIAIE